MKNRNYWLYSMILLLKCNKNKKANPIVTELFIRDYLLEN